MITHFAEIHLQTLSPIGVRQVYHDALAFPILSESEDDIRIAITPHTALHFTRSSVPIKPAHLAFEVRHSTYADTADLLEYTHVALCGDVETETTHQRYFKDGDGNILEAYSHDYVNESVIVPENALGVMYLREAGLVVDDLAGCWDWLAETFGTTNTRGDRNGKFSIVAAGTAHFVLNHVTRRWVPIDATALKPQMRITLGTPSLNDIAEIRKHPDCIQSTDGSLFLQREEYLFQIQHTPDFNSAIPQRLKLPHVD